MNLVVQLASVSMRKAGARCHREHAHTVDALETHARDADELLKRLYKLVEDGVTEVDGQPMRELLTTGEIRSARRTSARSSTGLRSITIRYRFAAGTTFSNKLLSPTAPRAGCSQHCSQMAPRRGHYRAT